MYVLVFYKRKYTQHFEISNYSNAKYSYGYVFTCIYFINTAGNCTNRIIQNTNIMYSLISTRIISSTVTVADYCIYVLSALLHGGV